jgi:hypothetical protein
MQKLTITISLVVIALALGTMATTTTMQIQPAFSQASHCVDREPPMPGTTCITPGQNPVETKCPQMCTPADLTHQDAGQAIGDIHRSCAQGTATGCFIGNPDVNVP